MTAIFVYENPNVALAARTLLLAGYAIENSRRQPTHIEILCHKTSALSLLAHCDHDDRACDAPRSRRPESQRTEGPDLLAARTTSQQRRATAFARQRNRALEVADRQAAANTVRAQIGEAGSRDRTAGVAAGRAGSHASGESSSIANTHCCRPHRECSKTGAAAAGASTMRNAKVSTEADRLSGLWRRVETSRRRCFGNPGVRAGAIQSGPAGSSEAGLRM